MSFFFDSIILTPEDIDLSRSPLAGRIDGETYVLGAFNPGMTRLPGGNLLLMVRIAEALRTPIRDDAIHALRWDGRGYVCDRWPLDRVVRADPRTFAVKDGAAGDSGGIALTSLSWLLPVELSADGTRVLAIHYDRAIAPSASYQCYGIEDARISRVGDRWLMTTCAVSPERQGTALYSADDAADWTLEGLVLDHQNKDMLIFEGLIDGMFWAETRPLGSQFFAYPPGSAWHAGPSINLASSPDARHWKPFDRPFLRPHAAMGAIERMGGGAPPILTDAGWLTLWHGVAPNGGAGAYRTYWSLLDRDEPWRVVHTDHIPLLEADPGLTRRIEDRMYLHDIVFTTGIVDAGDHVIIASGEADLACRITHVPKARFGL